MRIENIVQKIRPYLPFSALNTTWRRLDKTSKSILDVGCGKGEPMRFTIRKAKAQFKVIGVYIFEPYLRQAATYGCYSGFVLGDALKHGFCSIIRGHSSNLGCRWDLPSRGNVQICASHSSWT